MVFSGCRAPQQEALAEPVTFSCSADLSLQVSYRNEAAFILFFKGKEVIKEQRLPKVPSASGARYSDEEFTFWNKGKAVVYMQGDSVLYRCSEE